MRFMVTSTSFLQILSLLIFLFIAPASYGRDNTEHKVTFRAVTDNFSVSAQISPADVKKAAAMGYTLIINNRPDGEGGSSQPTSEALERAAKQAGIAYRYVPFRSGQITDQAMATMMDILNRQGDKKTLALCRSGTRAITIWAMAQSALGKMSVDELILAARRAGYNLERQRSQLEALAANGKR